MQALLKTAYAWGQRNHPQASNEQHAAFANSVLYLLFHASGGFGGPSLREHAVTWAAHEQALECSDPETAYTFVEPIVYGPLTDLHRQVWLSMQHLCFDNDPADVQALSSSSTT